MVIRELIEEYVFVNNLEILFFNKKYCEVYVVNIKRLKFGVFFDVIRSIEGGVKGSNLEIIKSN